MKNKNHFLQIICAIFMFILMIGCSNQEEVIGPLSMDDPLILNFQEPPFDLLKHQRLYLSNVQYGDYQQTIFDLFIPDSTDQYDLVIFIHGGGFIQGDKSDFYRSMSNRQFIQRLLDNQIAFASINYRLLEKNDPDGVLKPLFDVKRCVQFIRYHASQLNIDKNNIVLMGASAGASSALWMSTHDDMADNSSSDPVLRETTRVKGVALTETQATLDVIRWNNQVFNDFEDLNLITAMQNQTAFRNRILALYGISSIDQLTSPEISAYREQVDMLSMLSPDDPEIWCSNIVITNNQPNNLNQLFHHGNHVREIKAIADLNAVNTVVRYGNPIVFDNTNNENRFQFLLKKLRE